MRLALARVEVEAAREVERREPLPEATEARQRSERHARDALHRLAGHVGREAARSFLARLAHDDGGLALRAIAAAAPDLRAHALRAVVDHARIAEEHGVSTSAALALLGRAARWSAVANALLDRALRDPSAETIKLAQAASTSARLDLVGALDAASTYAGPTAETAVERMLRELNAPSRHEGEAHGAADEDDTPTRTNP